MSCYACEFGPYNPKEEKVKYRGSLFDPNHLARVAGDPIAARELQREEISDIVNNPGVCFKGGILDD